MGAVRRNRKKRTLCASLCEIERGVFYATYPDSEADTDGLATYQIGTSAADAKHRIELIAQTLGYESVAWHETIVAPLFASQAEPAIQKPTSRYLARTGS